MPPGLGNLRENQRVRAFEITLPVRLIVTVGEGPPPLGPSIKVLQLDQEERGLYLVQAEIPADTGVLVQAFAAMVPQAPEEILQLRVISQDHPPVPEPPPILGGVEGEGPPGPDASSLPSIVRPGADGLGRVLDDCQAVPRR